MLREIKDTDSNLKESFQSETHVAGVAYDNFIELAIQNQIDRFDLAIDVIDRVPKLQVARAHLKEWLKNQIIENTNHAHEYGIDKPEFSNWKWPY